MVVATKARRHGKTMTPRPLRRRPSGLLLAAACALAAGGCTPVGMAVGAGAMVGTAAAEERGLDGAARDVEIKVTLLKRFDEKGVLFRGVAATIMEGRVLLTGQTSEAAVLDEAVRIAWSIDGVKEVINEVVLTPEPATGTAARDALIEADLRAALTFDGEVLAINYALDVEDGVVYLLGIAQSEAERRRVVAHARGTDYVRRVVDYSILKTDRRRAHRRTPPPGVVPAAAPDTDTAPATAEEARP